MFVVVIAPKSKGSISETTDTEEMLTALRRQLQPHLIMALQGQKNQPTLPNQVNLLAPILHPFITN